MVYYFSFNNCNFRVRLILIFWVFVWLKVYCMDWMIVWMGCENMVNFKCRRSDVSFCIVKMSVVVGINICIIFIELKIFFIIMVFLGWYEWGFFGFIVFDNVLRRRVRRFWWSFWGNVFLMLSVRIFLSCFNFW